MKTIANLSSLWQQYFLQSRSGDTTFWSIVFIKHDQGKLLLSLANPLTDEQQEVFVDNVSSAEAALFAKHYKQRFIHDIAERFGLFRPAVKRVLTEYPDWPRFYDAWLNDDAQLLQANMPLLFDYPSADEYRAMQLKNTDYAGYRRLLVVLYQYRKQQFQHIFIQAVDDVQYAAIQQQIIHLYNDALPTIIMTEKQVQTV